MRFTVVDGEVLLDDRRLVTLDLAEIGDLVPREARHLLAKAGVLDHVLDKYRGGDDAPGSGAPGSGAPGSDD